VEHEIFYLTCCDFGKGNDPEDPTNVCVTIDARIGLRPEEGEPEVGSIFYFTVCTIKFIESELKRVGYFTSKSLIVLDVFTWDAADKAISSIIESVEADVIKCPGSAFEPTLGNFALWEFAGLYAQSIEKGTSSL
jgi:hypothetical protein